MVETERDGRLIEEEADKRIQGSLYPELRRVLCNYRHGILTLYGVVSSFHVRQIAQELVQGLEGIEVIDNQLVVAGKGSPISDTGPKYDGTTSNGATSDRATSDGAMSDGAGSSARSAFRFLGSTNGATSDGAGSTGLEEPALGRIPGEDLAGPASSGAQAD